MHVLLHIWVLYRFFNYQVQDIKSSGGSEESLQLLFGNCHMRSHCLSWFHYTHWLILPLELQTPWDLDTCINCLLASPLKMEQLTTLSLSRRGHNLEKRLEIFCFHIIGVIKRTLRKARIPTYQLCGQTGMQNWELSSSILAAVYPQMPIRKLIPAVTNDFFANCLQKKCNLFV